MLTAVRVWNRLASIEVKRRAFHTAEFYRMTAAVVAPSRRGFLAGAASLAALSLAGCATQRMRIETPQFSQYYLTMYGPLLNEPYPVPAIDLTKLDPNM